MFYNVNYSGNQLYNYSNNNQNINNYNQQNQINIQPYNTSNTDYTNNISYYNYNNYSNYIYNNNNNNFQPIVKVKKKKLNNKKVKFNESVCVIKVESYKEFNKLEDDDSNLDYINNYNKNININKKKGDKCECIII